MIIKLKTVLAVYGISVTVLVTVSPVITLAQNISNSGNRLFDFNIPAKSLSSALADFTAVTGIQVIRPDGKALAGRSVAVNGRQSPATALDRVLSGSSLHHHFIDDRTVSIDTSDAAKQDSLNAGSPTDDEDMLRTVNVYHDSGIASVYTAPGSSVYVSQEELDRYGTISTADALKGIPGVQVGDSRNGGGVDVNIRGIQGQSRVAVTVDGTQQALNVYRGYAGTQQRSYFDPDLVRDIIITKGLRPDAATPGAIGGTVAINTLRAEDIVLPGKNFGFRLKGELWDNGLKPPYHSAEIRDSSKLYFRPRDEKNNIFTSAAKSGSAALAFTNENFDFVAAYARRHQGNYVAGRYGHAKYRLLDEDGREQNSVAKAYAPGEEVLNTSARTESILLKSAIRPTDEQELELSYRRFDGHFGEIMPSDIFRFGTGGIYQYPEGEMLINSASARYSFNPKNNDRINLKASLWWTGAKSSQINGVNGPKSQKFVTDRYWVRMNNRRVGGNISNISEFATRIGDFSLKVDGVFQHEDIRPQKKDIVTGHDINQNRVLRDGTRIETGFSGQLDYRPVDTLTLWAGGRYSMFRSEDHNVSSTAVREKIYGRFIRAVKPGTWHFLYWRPDEDGNFTDATDPRLNNGLVFGDSNNPFDGTPYNDFGATGSQVYDAGWTDMVVGFKKAKPLLARAHAFAPAFGVSYEIIPRTFIYARYTEGIRLPSLFENTFGTLMVKPVAGLKPERLRGLEIGAGSTLDGLMTEGDSASVKLSYFNNDIKNFITRYYDESSEDLMFFRNARSYKTSGMEFQSRYDSGRIFADLSATYYFRTQTCDPAFAAHLRKTASAWRNTENTPDCTAGSFMGSYANTQNPPKLAVNITLGSRFLEDRLVIGGRMSYRSGPTAEIKEPWQASRTTAQIFYHPVALFDAFATYKSGENAVFHVSVQNITNRYYLDALAQSYMPAPGRTFRTGFTARF